MGHIRQSRKAGSGAVRRTVTIASVVAVAVGMLVGMESPASAVTCNNNASLYSNANGKFVSAELGSGYPGDYYGMLRARASSPGPWESFTLCNWGTYWTLESNANHRYVSVEVGYQGQWYGMLRARGTTIGPWERLGKNNVGSPALFTLYSDQNFLYVSAEIGTASTDWTYGMLRARASTVGNWEVFGGV